MTFSFILFFVLLFFFYACCTIKSCWCKDKEDFSRKTSYDSSKLKRFFLLFLVLNFSGVYLRILLLFARKTFLLTIAPCPRENKKKQEITAKERTVEIFVETQNNLHNINFMRILLIFMANLPVDNSKESILYCVFMWNERRGSQGGKLEGITRIWWFLITKKD